LLVGGAGFIGHNLALELKARGAEVAIVDSLQVNNLLSLHDHSSAPVERDLYALMISERLRLLRDAGVPIYTDDARDYHRLSKRFTDFNPTTVVLLAAVSHASRANKDPMTTLDHSFRTLENTLDNARQRGVHLVFLSSSMVYGNFSTPSVDEEAPTNPIGIYGAVKLGGEKLIAAYGHVFGLEYTIVRPAALYGPRCISRRVGQIFIENAIRGRDLVVMGDGSDRVDFTCIDDFVSGVSLTIARPEARGEIFNLTYGEARELNELASIVADAFPDIELQHAPRDALVPERGTLDVSKARELLGYAPRNPIEVGFRRYIDWYRELFECFDADVLDHIGSQPNE